MHYCGRVGVTPLLLQQWSFCFCLFLGYIYNFYYKTILLTSGGSSDSKIL